MKYVSTMTKLITATPHGHLQDKSENKMNILKTASCIKDMLVKCIVHMKLLVKKDIKAS